MCLAIPGQVEKIESGTSEMFRSATVSFGGVKRNINIAMVPEVKVGDFVLVHVGVALSVVDEEEAMKTFQYLKAIGELNEIEEGGADGS